MTKVKAVTGILLLAGGLSLPPKTSALQNAGGGWWCEESTGSWDEAGWHVKAGDCYYDPFSGSGGGSGGGTGEPPEPPHGGGGGTSSDPRGPDLELSSQLKCVMNEYLHPDVKNKMHSNRTMKRKDRWAFQQVVNGVAQPGTRKYVTTNKAPAGSNWNPVGGSADYGYAWGYLYNAAFESSWIDSKRKGVNPGHSDLNASGNLNATETSIFAIGHETAHLVINGATEERADWYGFYALQQYREDGGTKCKK